MDQIIPPDQPEIDEEEPRAPARIMNGTKMAEIILEDLEKRTKDLKQRNVVPTLSIVQVGDDDDSSNYIKQKQRAIKRIGGKLVLKNFKKSVLFQHLAEYVHMQNNTDKIHGIVIQRPLPATLSTSSFNTAVVNHKDVDGFRIKSPFEAPIALAVYETLREALELKSITASLKNKNTVIIGRGETGGKPIMNYLTEKKVPYLSANSATTSIAEFTKEADIIISCVGKPNVLTSKIIKEDAIVISVGIHKDEKGKLKGDYDEADIATKASFYTPTPGGIGPLNIAYLMQNLVDAAEGKN